jgi:hypothetical protein
MKQTAVEWLMQQLPTIDKYDPYYQDLFTQAKAMEKEQMIKFANDYIDDDEELTAEQYYNQKYKQD